MEKKKIDNMKKLPRYPIYVPSKGRIGYNALTARFLVRDEVPFHLVVEPQEAKQYIDQFGKKRVLILPWSGDDDERKRYTSAKGIENGGAIAARNWIMDHSISGDHRQHWQLDDNIRGTMRWYKDKSIPINSGIAFAIAEDFADRYENLAILGFNYDMFGTGAAPPFWFNCHVYSCSLVNNAIPYRWRIKYNEDTDICLQALSGGWCTVNLNVFLIAKIRTMTMTGGNTDDLYKGDGRLRMARSLERIWPNVVETRRRFRRPQHIVHKQWKMFRTPLKLKPDIDISMNKINEHGMTLKQVKPIRSNYISELLTEWEKKNDLKVAVENPELDNVSGESADRQRVEFHQDKRH